MINGRYKIKTPNNNNKPVNILKLGDVISERKGKKWPEIKNARAQVCQRYKLLSLSFFIKSKIETIKVLIGGEKYKKSEIILIPVNIVTLKYSKTI